MNRWLSLSTLPVLLACALQASAAGAGHEAAFYSSDSEGRVWCRLCPRKCVIGEGRRGACGVRENRGGRLFSLVYGKPCSVGVEPIEKAPLYHFMPGHKRFVIATAGCNLRCKHCQNWSISQAVFERVRSYDLPPGEVVDEAVRNGAKSICFTFTEPVIFYEYMFDVAKAARARGLKTSMITSGYINAEPMRKLLGALDAVKVDLKAFTEEFYERQCSGELKPVLDTLELVRREGRWLEIVNLVIPGQNDDPRDIRRMCRWIRKTLGPGVPVHFTRFFPAYKLSDVPPTPVETLERAYRIAKEEGLDFVYVGNVPGHEESNTLCPKCGRPLIVRMGYQIVSNSLKSGKCPGCGAKIPGNW
jgi:pyruvate formate lyase activating enzyme